MNRFNKRYVLLLIIAGLFLFFFNQKNHLNLSPIEVQQATALNQAKGIFESCGEGKGGEQCYSKELAVLTKNKTLDFALQTLSALEEIDPNARGCHLIAHSITLAETSKDPSKWKELLSKVDSNDCSGGFVHGVLEARSRLDSSFELNEKTIPEICDYVGQTHGQGGEFNCSHIMGHILMAENSGDIEKSNSICSKIAKDLQYECFSGVFMENETRDNLVAHGISQHIPWNGATTKEQEELCRKYDGVASRACWREVVHMYSFISFDNPQEVFKLCSQAPDVLNRDECYLHGVGIMTASNRFNLENMRIICEPYLQDEQSFKVCMGFVVNSLVMSSPKFADRVIRFCNEISEDYRKGCFQKLGDQLGTLVSPHERQSLCIKAPENYKSLCSGI